MKLRLNIYLASGCSYSPPPESHFSRAVQSSGCCKAAHFHHLCPYLLGTACSLVICSDAYWMWQLQHRGVCSQSVPKCDNYGVKVFGPM